MTPRLLEHRNPMLMVVAAFVATVAAHPCRAQSRVDWGDLLRSPETLIRELEGLRAAGEMADVETFSSLVKAIQESPQEALADYRAVWRALGLVQPNDTGVLLEHLSHRGGPGYALANIGIGRLLLRRELMEKDQTAICDAVAYVYREWPESEKNPFNTNWALVVDRDGRIRFNASASAGCVSLEPWRHILALEGIILLNAMAPLPEACRESLLLAIRDSKQMVHGALLANLLSREVTADSAQPHLATALDIVAMPPREASLGWEHCRAEFARRRLPDGLAAPRAFLRGVDSVAWRASLRADERGLLEWMDCVCDAQWSVSIAGPVQEIVIKCGKTGLANIYRRVDSDSTHADAKLRLLRCAAAMDADSERVLEVLLRVVQEERSPNWSLAAQVVRGLAVDKARAVELREAFDTWRAGKTRPNAIRDEEIRFLLATGAITDALSLLDSELSAINSLEASAPFFMEFLEDVPFFPAKYIDAMERLTRSECWWHRCAALVLLERYTDSGNHVAQLRKLSVHDPHWLVREVGERLLETRRRTPLGHSRQ